MQVKNPVTARWWWWKSKEKRLLEIHSDDETSRSKKSKSVYNYYCRHTRLFLLLNVLFVINFLWYVSIIAVWLFWLFLIGLWFCQKRFPLKLSFSSTNDSPTNHTSFSITHSLSSFLCGSSLESLFLLLPHDLIPWKETHRTHWHTQSFDSQDNLFFLWYSIIITCFYFPASFPRMTRDWRGKKEHSFHLIPREKGFEGQSQGAIFTLPSLYSFLFLLLLFTPEKDSWWWTGIEKRKYVRSMKE